MNVVLSNKGDFVNTIERVIKLEPADNQRLNSLCGPQNDNIKLLESRLNIEINQRDNQFTLIGNENIVDAGCSILQSLYQQTFVGNYLIDINPEKVHLAIVEQAAFTKKMQQFYTDKSQDQSKFISIKTKGGIIRPRTPNQADYISNILNNDITFGIGPAGTGKTYLAVATAVDALEKQNVHRLLLTRPAVEAGEKLGFLPGDLSKKVDPYLRPLYDALFEMLGFERVERLIEKNIIEIAPLAYMRGRTLNDAFIILDEGQNTTIEQMKMFLTRIGFNSRAVITGDVTQVDLPRSQKSGLKHAIDVLPGVDGIQFNFLDSDDVIRHPVVARIVNAYNKWDAQEQFKQAEKRRQLELDKLNNKE